MATVLTDAAVQRLKPGKARHEVRDGQSAGLYLVIQPTGKKSWALRFRRPDGRSAKLTLGPLDTGNESKDESVVGAPLSLRMARELAASIDRQRKLGVDVVAEEKAKKERKRREGEERAANTFGTAVREFCDSYTTKRRNTRPRRWPELTRTLGLSYPPDGGEPEVLRGSLADTWGDRPLAEIDDHDIHVAITEAKKHGIGGLKRRNNGVSQARGRTLHYALAIFFAWAKSERRIAKNPCLDVERPSPPPPRDRVLSTPELRWFWAATDQIGEPFGPLLKLLLLTGARREEVARMRWSELSEDETVWTLPAERSKNWRPLVLPLPQLARDILAGVHRFVRCPFVFSSNGRTPVTSFSAQKKQLDYLMLKATRAEAEASGRDPDAVSIPAWRIHDLRRSCASGMQRLKIRTEVIEKVLNHQSGIFRGVAGIYQVDPMLDDMQAALQRWATHIAGLVGDEPDNVLQFANVGAS